MCKLIGKVRKENAEITLILATMLPKSTGNLEMVCFELEGDESTREGSWNVLKFITLYSSSILIYFFFPPLIPFKQRKKKSLRETEQQKRERSWEKRERLRRERATEKERDSMIEERRESFWWETERSMNESMRCSV